MSDSSICNPLLRKPSRKFDSSVSTTLWFVKIIANDDKRRNGKEREAGIRLSNILLSDKILDDKFCRDVLPKIVDQHTNLVEENSAKYLSDLSELHAYELWHCTPEQWSYAI